MAIAFLRGVGRKKRIQPEGYLTFSSADPFTIAVNNATKNWDGALYYSTDTETWGEWDGATAIESAVHGADQRIYMRGVGNSKMCGSATYRWVLTGNSIRCEGNIENLLDYEIVANGEHPTMAEYCYHYMFKDCSNLVTAPELPAITLTRYCYASMFSGCSSLVTAPELPATTLADYCYYEMFNMCEGLTEAPELPAKIMARSCYYSMFAGCSSLVTAPELPATTLDLYCYQYMFRWCDNLATLPKLPATSARVRCYLGMFRDCPNIKLSVEQTDEYPTPYRVPKSGTGSVQMDSLKDMFLNTGGTFTGTPEINTTYYTSNTVV